MRRVRNERGRLERTPQQSGPFQANAFCPPLCALLDRFCVLRVNARRSRVENNRRIVIQLLETSRLDLAIVALEPIAYKLHHCMLVILGFLHGCTYQYIDYATKIRGSTRVTDTLDLGICSQCVVRLKGLIQLSPCASSYLCGIVDGYGDCFRHVTVER
jgi:hypothetical protein